MHAEASSIIIWAAVAVTIAGLLFRPLRIPEYVWAVAAALLLPLTGSLPVATFVAAVAEGQDVYLFLVGMMLLAELARGGACSIWCSWSARS